MSSTYGILQGIEHQLAPSMRKALHLAETTAEAVVKELAAALVAQGVPLLMEWLAEWAAKGKTALAPQGELTEEDKLTLLSRQAYDNVKAAHPDVRDSVINSAIQLAILGMKGYSSPLVGAPPPPAQLPNTITPERAPIVGPEDKKLF